MSPPVSVSGSSITCASDHDESRYLAKARWLQLGRLGFASLTMVVALVTLALEAHSLHQYHRTHDYAQWWLDLWPVYLDERPTVVAIIASVLIFVMATAYVVAALLPSPHPRIVLLNYISSVSGVLGVILACIATGLTVSFYNPHEDDGVIYGHTIRSWTCLWADAHTIEFTDREASGPETIDGVDGFRQLCMEARASWIFMMFLIIFAFGTCVTAAIGLALEKDMKNKRAAAAPAGPVFEERKQSV